MKSPIQHVPRTPLAALPTPVARLSAIGERYGHDALHIKRDSLSGLIYGGNKVRKLEFLLGEAQAAGCKRVITYGAVGSNHALATAVYCRELGLRAISILAPQKTNAHVRRNILMQYAVGAELHLYPQYSEFPGATQAIVRRCTLEDGIEPCIIPAGGTNVIGALGFVNAAFEMAEQIEPDVIYIPFGTGGTLAGLLVGLKLAGLKTRVEAIRVVDPAFRNERHINKLCKELYAHLKGAVPGRGSGQPIPPNPLRSLHPGQGNDIPPIDETEISIRNEFFGEGYGIPTSAGSKAVKEFEHHEGIYLENTYTGKTAAALLHDLRSGALEGKRVLFWNTLNSRDLSEATAEIDYRDLPPAFHPYF